MKRIEKTPAIVAAIAVLFIVIAGIVIWRTNSKPESEESMATNVVMYVTYGDDSYIMIDQENGGIFTITMPNKIYDESGKEIAVNELKKGNILELYGDGIMLNSYPGQYHGVTKVVVKEKGTSTDADQYQDLIDALYQEPNPADRPELNVEYRTELAQVTSAVTSGGYKWSYEDENGETNSETTDSAFILDWSVMNDVTLDVNSSADLTLLFTKEPESITVERYSSDLFGNRIEGSETPEGEKVDISTSDNGYILKNVVSGYVYRIVGTWENGTVEYGFLTK